MTPAQLGLPALAGHEAVAFVLVLGRVGGLFAFAPIFSSTLLPKKVRLVVAAALSLALTPIASHGMQVPGDALTLGGLLLKEIGVGLVIAFAIGILAAGVQAGAALLDTIVGFSFAQVLDPFTGVQSAVLGQVYSVFATVVLLLTGGDQLIVEGMAASYRIVPLGGFPHLSTLTRVAVAGFTPILVLALEISAPVLIALVVTDAAFGLISRAVPQMNAFTVALPAKVAVAFLLVAVSLPFVSIQLQNDIQSTVLQTLQSLAH